VKKFFNGLETSYLDGFQYKFTYIWEAPSGTMANAGMKLRIIPTSEGHYDSLLNLYVYNYTDHLGNVRISYADSDHDGNIRGRDMRIQHCTDMGGGNQSCYDDFIPGEIVSNDTYYPFGLLHNYSGTTENAYQYKYQGQELQETGFYSFKWRNYMPDVGRFFNIDPLAEKYTHNSTYAFSENRVIDARELEGLEAVLVNDTVEWRVKVNNNLGSDYSTTLLQDAADILSQNPGLTVKIIQDPKALFTVNLDRPKSKFTEDGISTTNGFTKPDGNIYDGSVTSKDSPRTLAHELGHKASLPHIFDDTSKDSNTVENKKNLMNSDGNDKVELRDTAGTNLTPSQTTDIKNHIKITNENRVRKEEELKKQNTNPNANQ